MFRKTDVIRKKCRNVFVEQGIDEHFLQNHTHTHTHFYYLAQWGFGFMIKFFI